MLREILKLILVTDDILLGARDPVQLCRSAVAGGVTMVQLRLKHASDREILVIARRLIPSLTVPVLINDRTDIAIVAGAAGVHLGPDDLHPARARRIAPPGFLIGASVGSPNESGRAASADYWGIGPLHGSLTKEDAGAPLEWAGVGAIQALAGAIPCVVIGGVRPEDSGMARQTGLSGVAVISGILAAPDAALAAAAYRLSWDA